MKLHETAELVAPHKRQPLEPIVEPLRSVEVLLAAPRGFCAGVRRAIDVVEDALALHGPPIFVRRPIVHNMAVVKALEAQGTIFVEELDQVPPGAVVILSAHGVPLQVAQHARARGLIVHDAVCPLVAKIHREVARHHRAGRHILLIGHAGHPEIEGTLGQIPTGNTTLIESVTQASRLMFARDARLAYAVQTTFSVRDAEAIIAVLEQRFTNLEAPRASDICYATTNRQEAARAIALQADAMVVVGADFSSNACRLVEVAGETCSNVQLVARADQIGWAALAAARTIGITAAASTPEESVAEILAALSHRYRIRLREVTVAREEMSFRRLDLG